MTTTPRGVRNNNPGNIRNSERNDWTGEVSKADKGQLFRGIQGYTAWGTGHDEALAKIPAIV